MFLDRLVENWDSLIFPWEDADKDGMLEALCNEVECFNVNNVARYIVDKGGIELRDNIPMARPPFNSVWYEYNVWGGGYLKSLAVFNTFVGETRENDELLLEYSGVCFAEGISESHNKFIMVSNVFKWTCEPKGGICGVWLWDNKGEIIGGKEQTLGAMRWTALAPMWLANSFMHCKNTVLEVVNPPDRLNYARLRRGKRPLISYRILDIRPINQILEAEGRINQVGLKKALHICRGHFKDYTDKGLFGKLHGLYWWSPYVRGDIREGIALKDYRVHTN